MIADDLPADFITRSAADIARSLELIVARGVPLLSHVARGTLQFVSRLLYLDPQRRFIVVEASREPEVNAALLSRLRTVFHASIDRRHLEFAASGARPMTYKGNSAIVLKFPDVLVGHTRRAHARIPVLPPLACVADAAGDMPFDGQVVDISRGGIGLLYPTDITLEPGTLLQGCRINMANKAPCTLDLEVRYSQVPMLADVAKMQRSGCRFVEPSNAAVRALTALYATTGDADDSF